MQKFLNKPNAYYLLAGALAIPVLFISVAITAAPYIGFLAPIAALNVNLPFVIGCAVLSVVVIAFSSYKLFQNSINATKEDVYNFTPEEVKADNTKQDEDDNKEPDQTADEQDKDDEEELGQNVDTQNKADGEELNQTVDEQDKDDDEELDQTVDTQDKADDEEQGVPVAEPDNQKQVETIKENNTDNKEQGKAVEEPDNQEQNKAEKADHKKQNEQRLKQEPSYIELAVAVGCMFLVGFSVIYRASGPIDDFLAAGSAMINVNASAVNSAINSVVGLF